jgi:hypothetical protein
MLARDMDLARGRERTFTAVRSGLGSVGALCIMKEDLLENTAKKKSQHAHITALCVSCGMGAKAV